jgi:hypothetical protein
LHLRQLGQEILMLSMIFVSFAGFSRNEQKEDLVENNSGDIWVERRIELKRFGSYSRVLAGLELHWKSERERAGKKRGGFFFVLVTKRFHFWSLNFLLDWFIIWKQHQ